MKYSSIVRFDLYAFFLHQLIILFSTLYFYWCSPYFWQSCSICRMAGCSWLYQTRKPGSLNNITDYSFQIFSCSLVYFEKNKGYPGRQIPFIVLFNYFTISLCINCWLPFSILTMYIPLLNFPLSETLFPVLLK
jgi:hypothetical protein